MLDSSSPAGGRALQAMETAMSQGEVKLRRRAYRLAQQLACNNQSSHPRKQVAREEANAQSKRWGEREYQAQ